MHALPFISHVHAGQYKTALEHMSVRAGTAIPTGAAEGALAFLYEQREQAWPFLAKRLIAVDVRDNQQEAVSPTNDIHPANGREKRQGSVDTKGEAAVASKPGKTDGNSQPNESGIGQQEGQQEQREGLDQQNEKSITSGDTVPETFSLAHMSGALEAFGRACSERDCALEGLAVQDLVNFLYLGGQAKVRFKFLGVPLEDQRTVNSLTNASNHLIVV